MKKCLGVCPKRDKWGEKKNPRADDEVFELREHRPGIGQKSPGWVGLLGRSCGEALVGNKRTTFTIGGRKRDKKTRGRGENTTMPSHFKNADWMKGNGKGEMTNKNKSSVKGRNPRARKNLGKG